MNHKSENLKVMHTKCSMSYAMTNYQFNSTEMENLEKLVKQTVKALRPYYH